MRPLSSSAKWLRTSKFRWWFALLLLAFCWPAPASQAQQGQFLEGLLRTVGEAAIERERRKRLEEERRLRELDQVERLEDPIGFDIPPRPLGPIGGGPGRQDGGGRQDGLGRPGTDLDGSRRIELQSRQAAEFVTDLIAFQQTLERLISDVQQRPAPRPLRLSTPTLIDLSARATEILRRSDGMANLQRIADSYLDLDAEWRTVSHRMTTLVSDDRSRAQYVDRLDQLADEMLSQLGVQPRFNQIALQLNAASIGAYMQALIDDLQLLDSRSRNAQLAHRVRVIREQMLLEADSLDQLEPEQVQQRFSEFATDWAQLSDELERTADPHVRRRLDRIRELGLETFDLLRLDRPASTINLAAATARLNQLADQLARQLTLRSIRELSSQDQDSLFRFSRELVRLSQQLSSAASKSIPYPVRETQSLREQIRTTWSKLAPLARKSAITRVTIDDIDDTVAQLSSGLAGSTGSYPDYELRSLVSLAATIEGGTQSLQRHVRELAGRLRPESFANQFADAASEIAKHAEHLHDELSSRQPDREELVEEMELIVKNWQVLTSSINRLAPIGSRPDVLRIRQEKQQLDPVVTQLATALLDRQ